MDGMEEKLGAILGNPQMMQQIMALAQSMGSQSPPPEPPPKQEGPDPAMMQKMMTALQSSGVDAHQQALLSALNPYLTRDRISRLERAMRAAKLAGMATAFLGGGGHV